LLKLNLGCSVLVNLSALSGLYYPGAGPSGDFEVLLIPIVILDDDFPKDLRTS
jgi:hypothetical protein